MDRAGVVVHDIKEPLRSRHVREHLVPAEWNCRAGDVDSMEMMRMTAPTEFDTVDVLTVEGAHALFERRSMGWLRLSRVDFLDALERDDFRDRMDEMPVRDLIALLPFALAE